MARPALSLLGRRIRSERQSREWTLTDLARRCGVSAATLSKVENGRMGLGYENLIRVADGLGIPVTELFETEAGTAEGGRRSLTAKAGARRFVIPGYDLYYFAADVLRKRLVPMLIKVKARTLEEAGGLRFHKGEEVYYVVAGTAVLHTSDYAPLRVRAGECVFMDGQTGHAFTARRDGAVIFSVNEGYPVYSAATGAVFDVEEVARKRPRHRRATSEAMPKWAGTARGGVAAVSGRWKRH